MPHVTDLTQKVAGAIAARSRGQFDEAVFILEALWQKSGPKYEIGIELIKTLRGLARDIIAADSLAKGLGGLPAVKHHGFNALDPDLLKEMRSDGFYNRLRRTFHGYWMVYWVDLYEADDAFAIGDIDRADKLLALVPPDRLPVPWYFLAARISLHRGDVRSALVAASLVAGLNQNARQACLLIGEILSRDGRISDALPFFARANDLYDVDLLADMRRSLLPMTICERYSRSCFANPQMDLPSQLTRINLCMKFGSRCWVGLSWLRNSFKQWSWISIA